MRARVLVNGALSEPWDERASALGRLLFHIVFDAISAGVSLGCNLRAPRVSLLLYADDLVIVSAESEAVHRGLAARIFRSAIGFQNSLAARISGALRP